MSRQVIELENVLQLLIDEHKRLLAHLEAQQASMKILSLEAIQDCSHRQESSRLRIATLDTRRRSLSMQIARAGKLGNDATLQQIAAAFPANAARLLELRAQLREMMQQISQRTHVAGRLAVAVLGHLNTAMRLFAGAVGQSGTYTKSGAPRVANRIGVMEAVG